MRRPSSPLRAAAIRLRCFITSSGFAALSIGCGGSGGDTTTPSQPAQVAGTLTLVASSNGYFLGSDTATVVFHVSDQSARNMAGAQIALTPSAGTVIGGNTATTIADGTAIVRWVLPATSGSPTLTGNIGTNLQQVFTAAVTTSLVGTWSGAWPVTGVGGTVQISIQLHAVARNATCPLTGEGVVTTASGQKGNLSVTGNSCGGTFTWIVGSTLVPANFAGTVQSNDTRVVGTLSVGASGGTVATYPMTMTRISIP